MSKKQWTSVKDYMSVVPVFHVAKWDRMACWEHFLGFLLHIGEYKLMEV